MLGVLPVQLPHHPHCSFVFFWAISPLVSCPKNCQLAILRLFISFPLQFQLTLLPSSQLFTHPHEASGSMLMSLLTLYSRHPHFSLPWPDHLLCTHHSVSCSLDVVSSNHCCFKSLLSHSSLTSFLACYVFSHVLSFVFSYDFHFISLIWCHIISVLFFLPHLSSPAGIWLWILSACCSPFLSLEVWIQIITHIPQSAFCFIFLASLWSGLLPPRTFNCLPFQLCHPPHFFFYFFSVTGNLAAFHHF